MPFYEYQCRACGRLTEVLQKVSDPPLKKCPECGKSQLVKLVSAPVFRLKGGGWYETDFKSDAENKRNLVGEKDEPKPAAEDKGEKKADATEAKPAAEASPKPAAKSETTAAAAKPRAKARAVKTAARAKRAGSKRR
jgi:putative FmdB family regulatory protein